MEKDFIWKKRQNEAKSTQRTVQFEPFSGRYFGVLPLPWVGGWVGEKHIPDFRTK